MKKIKKLVGLKKTDFDLYMKVDEKLLKDWLKMDEQMELEWKEKVKQLIS